MNEKIVREKLSQVNAGVAVVMSESELDWLIDNDLLQNDVVSMQNPKQVGTLDTYLVGKLSCPAIQAKRAAIETLTSAIRANAGTAQVWDVPTEVASARGWYWPLGSTRRGDTVCAGHYLDYGPDYPRFDDKQLTEPGTIHCVVIAQLTGQVYSSRHVETPEAARSWIEQEANKAGHIA